MLSILQNSPAKKRERTIKFNIVVDEPYFDGVFNADKVNLVNIFCHQYPKNVHNYDLFFLPIPYSQKHLCSQFVSYAWPNTIFLKLFFSNFLPYKRYLYLDGDTLCIGDIQDIWDVDLGTHCLGACEHHSPFVKNGVKIYNAGVILMDLEKMKEYNFAKGCEESIKIGQQKEAGYIIQKKDEKWYTEETAMFDYSVSNPDYGILDMDLRFNMCAHHIPYDFDGKNFSGEDKACDVPITFEIMPKKLIGETVQDMKKWLSQLVLIHYYYWEDTPSKPWQLNRLQKYKKAGCPSYAGKGKEHLFWKTFWKHNPWSFVQWYEYYKKFLDIKTQAQSMY
jgi:hypothetical protein